MGGGFFYFPSFLTSVSDDLTLDAHMELHLGNLHATTSLRFDSRKRPLAVSGH